MEDPKPEEEQAPTDEPSDATHEEKQADDNAGSEQG